MFEMPGPAYHGTVAKLCISGFVIPVVRDIDGCSFFRAKQRGSSKSFVARIKPVDEK